VVPNLLPQLTALSECSARLDLLATEIISEVVLPEPGGGWAPGR